MSYAPAIPQLNKGDLIAVSYNNYFCVGIFRGYGKYGNCQFWRPNAVVSSNQNCIKYGNKFRGYIDYINTSANQRVLKVTEENLTPAQIDELEEAYKILIHNNLIEKQEYEARKQQERLYQGVLRGDYQDVDFG